MPCGKGRSVPWQTTTTETFRRVASISAILLALLVSAPALALGSSPPCRSRGPSRPVQATVIVSAVVEWQAPSLRRIQRRPGFRLHGVEWTVVAQDLSAGWREAPTASSGPETDRLAPFDTSRARTTGREPGDDRARHPTGSDARSRRQSRPCCRTCRSKATDRARLEPAGVVADDLHRHRRSGRGRRTREWPATPRATHHHRVAHPGRAVLPRRDAGGPFPVPPGSALVLAERGPPGHRLVPRAASGAGAGVPRRRGTRPAGPSPAAAGQARLQRGAVRPASWRSP